MFDERGISYRKPFALDVCARLALLTNLKLCLDAGDPLSYRSGQSWLDRSGNGYDFFLGADGSATASDPTWNPVGQLSRDSYWSFDGGDYFTYDSTNESWMDNIHKDNAVFTILGWIYRATGTANWILGTNSGTANTGFHFGSGTNGSIFIRVFNAGATVLSIGNTAGTVPENQWTLIGIVLNEATGANGGDFIKDGAFTGSFTSTYSSPAAGAASFTMQCGARGNGEAPMGSGSRMGMVCAWDRKLVKGEAVAFFNATRGRFGI